MSNNAFRAFTVLVALILFSASLLLAIGAPVMVPITGGSLPPGFDVRWLWVLTGVSGYAMFNRMGVL